MFHTNISERGCNNGGNSNTVDASLVITATGSSSAGRYGRLWRRSISVGIFISLKKTASYPGNENSLQSTPSPSPSPLITDNSFSGNSFRDPEASSPSYVPLPKSPTSETESQHTIDILSSSENEVEEEKNNEEEKLLLNHAILRIVKDRDLIGLKRFGGVEKVASVFGTDLENGSQRTESQQMNRDNNNSVSADGFFHFLLKASKTYTIYLLLISAGLSFATEIMEQGLKDGWHDGVAILAGVFMLVMFPSVADFHRARKLRKKEKNPKVEVVRGGMNQFITISDLVEGEIVRLREGDRVPGDGLFVNGDGLELDDKLNPKADFDYHPFLFYGSKVRHGSGSMLVVSVRDDTILGKDLKRVVQDPSKKKLIDCRVAKPNIYIENLSLAVSVCIAIVVFLRLLCRKHDGIDGGVPELKGGVSVDRLMKMLEKLLLQPQGRIGVLASVLTVVVIAIQHGMPFAITISLSYWNEKVVGTNKAKPRNLSATTTMGVVTVICTDVSGGGLVCDTMEVNKFWVGEKDVANKSDDAADWQIDPVVIKALERAVCASVLVPEISVSPAYDLLKSWARSRWSLNLDILDQHLLSIDYTKMSSDGKVYGVLMENNEGDEDIVLHTHWTGAASTVLKMCSHYYDVNGVIHLIKDEKIMFQNVIKDMEENDLRPVAFACKQSDSSELNEIEEDGLLLLALAGVKYSCSEEIKSAMEALRRSGISLMLISEDELQSVRAIAREIGICRLGICRLEAIEGKEFRDMNVSQRMEKLDQAGFLGSCLAEDKLLVVQTLQQSGHVVAFFGGGGSSTNDIPALLQADVAIIDDTKSMDISKESSDMTIYSFKDSSPLILKMGRFAYRNIQKFSQLQLTVSISGLLITFIATAASSNESPITTAQMIWVNWVTGLLGGMMMVMEFPSTQTDQETIFVRTANHRTQSLITKPLRRDLAIQVISQVSILLIFHFKGKDLLPTMDADVQRAIIYSSFTLCQIINQLRAMDITNMGNLLVVIKHRYFLMALGSVTAAQVLLVEFAASLMDCQKLNGTQWVICILLAALPWSVHLVLSFLSKCNSESFSNGLLWQAPWWSWPLILPFSMFLVFSLSNY